MPEENDAFFPHLSDHLTAISEMLWPEFFAVLWISLVAMAVLQLVKDLSPIRRWFQRWWFTGWVRERLFADLRSRFFRFFPFFVVKYRKQRKVAKSFLESVVDLVAPRSQNALFDLPSEQFTGQLAAGIRVATEYPETYSEFIVVFAEGAMKNDMQKVIGDNYSRLESLITKDATPDDLRKSLDDMKERRSKNGKSSDPSEAFDHRNRISAQIQRNLDTIPIAMGRRWRFLLRFLAMVISGLLIAAHAWFGKVLFDELKWFGWFVVVVVAGYLAPVFHDAFARVRGLEPDRS